MWDCGWGLVDGRGLKVVGGAYRYRCVWAGLNGWVGLKGCGKGLNLWVGLNECGRGLEIGVEGLWVGLTGWEELKGGGWGLVWRFGIVGGASRLWVGLKDA